MKEDYVDGGTRLLAVNMNTLNINTEIMMVMQFLFIFDGTGHVETYSR